MHLIPGKHKNRTFKSMVMKNSLHITANFDQPGFLESLVEKLAYRRYDIGYVNARVPEDHQAIDTSSTETYTSGTVVIDENEELINMPFITRFFFTCTKKENEPYKLAWSVSLS